jgi:hypothetical protein
VNGGTTFAGKTVRLTSNIDLSAHFWVPIGGNRGISGNTPTGYAFEGTFDGGYTPTEGSIIQRYAITGLNIQWNSGDTTYLETTVNANTSYAAFGLFGIASGTLQNINVSGSIASDARLYETGGVVGTSTGNIYNCTNGVTINLTSQYAARTGGIVGEAANYTEGVSNVIQFCNNTATLNVVRYGGGIAGNVDSTYAGGINISQCYNTGNITDTAVGDAVQVGGIAGGCSGYIINCYSMNTITMSQTASRVGGLVGQLSGTNALINRSYANVTYAAAENTSPSLDSLMPAFGYVGNNTAAIGHTLWVENNGVKQTIGNGSNNWGKWLLAGSVDARMLTGTLAGSPIVYITTGTGETGYTTGGAYNVMTLLGSAYTRATGSYPVLTWQNTGLTYGSFGIGSGTQDDPFRIQNQADLEAIDEALSGNNGFSGKYFKIMNAITLGEDWQGIGNLDCQTALTNSPYPGSSAVGFAGILNGNNQTITIARVVTNQNGQGGVINYLAPTGQVTNLTVSGTMTITYTDAPDCESTVEGISAFGGIVGYNCGVIDNVSSRVTITNSTGSGNATYETETQIYNVGGIAGFNDAFYQVGARGTIINSRNYNDVTGYEKVGGIVGENAGLIASCYNGGQITPTSTRRSGAGGIAGRNGNNNTAVEVGIIRSCANYGNIYSGIVGTSTEDKDTQSSWIGGITGWLNEKSEVYSCYNYGNVRGYGYAGYIVGGTGYTTADDLPDRTAGVFYCNTGSDTTGATTGRERGYNGTVLQGSSLGDLNTNTGNYGTFSLVTNIPFPDFNATAVSGAADGWEKVEKVAYLDTSATTNGDGSSASSPYNNLKTAVDAVGMGKIYVMSTVNITSRTTIWDNIEFIRYTENNFTGPMFNINAPDSIYPDTEESSTEEETTYVTFDSGVFDASDVGTVFNVEQGRLRLRGGTQINNAQQGVTVKATSTGNAEIQLEEVYINTTQAVSVAGNDSTSIRDQKNGIFYSESGPYAVKLLSEVCLGNNTIIQLSSKITCPFTYECADPSTGRVVFQGIKDRTIKSEWFGNATYVEDAVNLIISNEDIANNTATMANVYVAYVDGTLSTNGTGTKDSPYNNLASAMSNTTAKIILVTGTTSLVGGTYADKIVQCFTSGSSNSPFVVFAANNMGTTSTFDGMSIYTTAPGEMVSYTTAVEVDGGNLVLDGGTSIANPQIAVDMLAGSCTVKDTQVSASEYSFRVEDYLANLYFNMVANTKVDGVIYLALSEVEPLFYISSALTCDLIVECGDAYSGYIIAEGFNYSVNANDAAKVSYVNGSYRVSLQGGYLVLTS